MTIVTMTLAEAKQRAYVDRAALDATTEADMERHAAEDDAEADREIAAWRLERQLTSSGS